MLPDSLLEFLSRSGIPDAESEGYLLEFSFLLRMECARVRSCGHRAVVNDDNWDSGGHGEGQYANQHQQIA